MRKVFVFALLLAWSPLLAMAQDENAPKKSPDAGGQQKVEGKVSYILGYNLGSNLKDDPFQLDIDRFIKGLKDAIGGGDAEMSKDDMQATMQAFQQQILSQEKERVKGEAEKNLKAGEAFLKENGKREGVKTTESGLEHEVVKAGDGPMPAATDTVSVHYTGTLLDGTKFDSSYDRGQPASFPVNQVIPGWTEALQLMKVGSKWKLAIPANLAYGERGAGGVIGPNETLLFDVELLGIEGKDKKN